MRKTGHKATTAAAASMLPQLDEMFKGFADPTRIRILNVIAAGELCVCDIHDILELPQPLVSRHLARLRNAGLVTVERTSQFAHYRLASPQNSVQRNLVNCVKSCFKGIEGLDRERAAAEARVAVRKEDPHQAELSHLSYEWTRYNVSAETKEFLAALPFRLDLSPFGGHKSGPQVVLVHGTPTLNTLYWTQDRSDDFCLSMAAKASAKKGDTIALASSLPSEFAEYLTAGGKPNATLSG